MFLRAVMAVFVVATLSAAVPAHARHDDDSIECRSSGYKYNECEAPFRHPQLVQQISDSECVVNKNWGYNRDTGSIWVSDGCSGVFADSRGQDSRNDRDDRYSDRDRRDDGNDRDDRNDRSREEVVECRSSGYAFARCDVSWRRARLIEQLSGTRCNEGENWGIDRDGLWVDKGCGGRFAGH